MSVVWTVAHMSSCICWIQQPDSEEFKKKSSLAQKRFFILFLYGWISQLLHSIISLPSTSIEIAVISHNYSVLLWIITEGLESLDYLFFPAILFWQEWSKATSWPSWQDIVRKKLSAIQQRILGAMHARSHSPGDQENQSDICDPDLEVPFRAWCHKVTSMEEGDYHFLPQSQQRCSTGTSSLVAGGRI